MHERKCVCRRVQWLLLEGEEDGSRDGKWAVGGMADGDDIVTGNDGQQSGGADWGNGLEDDVRDDEAGYGRQLGNGLMDWDEQYRRMSLDDRLLVELSSIGLLPVQAVCGGGHCWDCMFGEWRVGFMRGMRGWSVCCFVGMLSLWCV